MGARYNRAAPLNSARSEPAGSEFELAAPRPTADTRPDGELRPVLPRGQGGRDPKRSLDLADRPRANQQRERLQRAATLPAKHLPLGARPAPADARARGGDRAPPERGRADAGLPPDAGRPRPRSGRD